MAPKQNENQNQIFEDAENSAAETLNYLSGKKDEEVPPTLTEYFENTDTGKDLGTSMQVLGIKEEKKLPRSVPEERPSEEPMQSLIDSWSEALGIEEEQEPSDILDPTRETREEQVSSSVDSLIKSLGIEEGATEDPLTVTEKIDSISEAADEQQLLSTVDSVIKLLGIEVAEEPTITEQLGSSLKPSEEKSEPNTVSGTVLIGLKEDEEKLSTVLKQSAQQSTYEAGEDGLITMIDSAPKALEGTEEKQATSTMAAKLAQSLETENAEKLL